MRGSPAGVSRLARRMPIPAILAFLITRAILVSHHHIATDIRLYHEYVLRAAAGEVPYRDIAIVYPPAAWWVMAMPHSTDWPTYRDRFRRMMLVADVAAFALFVAILLRRRAACARWGCLTYVVATAALEHLLYDRLDVGLLFLLMLWAYAWVRAAPRASQCTAERDHEIRALEGIPGNGAPERRWAVAAYFALGVGAAYKLAPGVMLPFVLMSEMAGRRWRPLLVHLAGFATGLTVPFLVHYPNAGLATLGFLKYHLDRGIQIESVYAVLLWVMSSFGLPLAVANLPDTIDVISPGVPAMVRLSSILSIAFVGALGVRASWLGRRYDGEKAYVYSGLALVGLILFAKVLSPQYFIWIVPVLLLCGAELLPERGFMLLCALLTVLAVLTTVVFPRGLRDLLALDARILWVLAARNLLFATLVFWMVARLGACPRNGDTLLVGARSG